MGTAIADQDEQIQQIADRCTEVKFHEGADVVTQDEHGDTFYVISRGSADVLRYEEADDDGEEVPLGEAKTIQLSAKDFVKKGA